MACIWIEVVNKHKHILFGVFYRPPNANSNYYSSIKDYLHLAVDTGKNDIIVTGDFNFNLLSSQTSRKIASLCSQFAFNESIDHPTYYTENSASLLDITLVHNKDSFVFSGVGDPFLGQDLRYHSPVFGILKISKPKLNSYVRNVWIYDQADHQQQRMKAAATDWASLFHNDLNVYASNITNRLMSIAKKCIPNKTVRKRPSDQPWLACCIIRYLRKRKREYRKAKQTNSKINWNRFKKLRNIVVSLIRESKQAHIDKL